MSTVATETAEFLAENCRILRLRRKMTQEGLAESCKQIVSGQGWSRPRISEIESGEFNPSLETIETLALALGVSVAKLVSKP